MLSVTSSIIYGQCIEKIVRGSCSSDLNRPFVVVKESSPPQIHVPYLLFVGDGLGRQGQTKGKISFFSCSLDKD